MQQKNTLLPLGVKGFKGVKARSYPTIIIWLNWPKVIRSHTFLLSRTSPI